MHAPHLHALLILLLLYAVADTCDELGSDDDDSASIENTLAFTGSSLNSRSSDSVVSDQPEDNFTAQVVITSNDAIEPSDVRAFIEATCRDGGGNNFEITLNQDGLTGLTGRRTVNARFCNDQQTGQRGQVTYRVVVQRLNRFITFTAVVSAEGG